MSRHTLLLVASMLVLVGAMVVVSRYSIVVFGVVAAALLLLFAYAAYRLPRGILVAVTLAPIFDRYLISLLIPPQFGPAANFLSEGLLLLAAVMIAIRGARDGTLLDAIRHPAFPILVLVVAIGGLSALLNGVPPVVAVAGIVFTIEAVALFFLPRIVGFGPRAAAVAAAIFVGVATIAALLAIGQVVVIHNFLGMETSSGRFGEGQRVTAFFGGNPNMLGAVLAMAVPFPAFAAWHATGWRRWALFLVAYVLELALLFTFSRGAWLGLALAMLVVGITVSRRALLTVVAIGLLAYGTAHVIPRNLVWLFSGPNASSDMLFQFDIGAATLGRIDSIAGGRDLRVLFIENATPIIGDHPLLGVGPGRYGGAVAKNFGSPIYATYTQGVPPEGRTVDNFWLHLVVELGVLGALTFAALLALACWRLIVGARRVPSGSAVLLAGFACTAIVLGVDSLTEMLLEGNTTSFTMWFFLGVGSALLAWHRRHPGSEPAGALTEPA